MLTPQEVAEHAFAKANFGGYNMAMVDDFLDELTEDYTALYEENAVLKRKMKVLADKVEEYRATDDAMRKALLTVQRQADAIVAEAEEKRAEVLQDAETAAMERKRELNAEIEAEEQKLESTKAAVAAYIAEVKASLEKAQGIIGLMEEVKVELPAEEPAEVVEEAVEEVAEVEEPAAEAVVEETDSIVADIEKTIGAEAPVEEAPAAAEVEEPKVEEPTRRIKLDDLQFGKDFKF